MANPNDQPQPPIDKTPAAEPPGGGRQDHFAMRADAMIPVTGGASTDTLAAGGGLDVPGREPEATLARLSELETVTPEREIIPGAYEPDTATHREPGAMGGRFNGADAVSAHDDVLMDDRGREEMRRIGGGEKHERKAQKNDQRTGRS